jgi:glycosyltransferase involved in cell wall biosynthesis
VILADSQYADWLADRVELTRFDDVLAKRWAPLRRLVGLPRPLGGLVRGLLLASAGRHAAVVVVNDNLPGVATLLFVEAWVRRRRRVVMLQFRRREQPRRAWARAVYEAWLRLVRRPAVRRAMAEGHVASPREQDGYAIEYAIPKERLVYIPWPWRQFRDQPAVTKGSAATDGPPLVLSSGRTQCDWKTMVEAANGRPWKLVIVCSRHDIDSVRMLPRGPNVEVRGEIPLAEHAELMARARVYAMAMEDHWVSAGHVRLMHANQHGVPVVATRTPALDDYVADGETALLVPPGDPEALRNAIERILGDPALAERLRRAADERSMRWVRDDYLDALAELVGDVAARCRSREAG